MDISVERPFQTLPEYQEAHEQLLELFNAQEQPEGAALGGDADGADDGAAARYCLIAVLKPLQRFLGRGAAGGAYLHEPKERRAAQGMLDYWASQCYGANLDVPRPLLLAHDPALLPSLLNEACPYVGLEAFDEGRARQFFGREERIDALVSRLEEERLVVVTGASGSGKSSLVLAGVLPALRGGALEGSAGWRYLPPLVPGTAPLESLAMALGKALRDESPPGERAAWQAEQARRLLEDPGWLATLLGGEGQVCVLVVDQFEETMTLRTEANAPAFAAFVAALQSLVEVAEPPHRLLLTMRNDVDTQLAREYPELNRRYSSAAFPLSSMDSTQLREAIEAPAAQVGLKFQEGVVDDLIRSVVGEEAGLPLLQYNLIALWERRRGNLVTLEAHHAVGSPRQAMAEAARRLYGDLPAEQQLAVGPIFLALTRQGEGATVFRNRMTRRQLREVADPNATERVLEKFERARLLRVTRPNPDEPLDDVIEVVHEALLRNWDLLQRLFSERREERARRAFLRKQAQSWREANFDPAFLLSGLALKQAVVESRREPLGPLEQDFIRKSAEAEAAAELARAEEAQRREQLQAERVALALQREAAAKRDAKWFRVTAMAACLVLLIAGLLAWWGWRQASLLADRRLADAQSQIGEVQRKAEAEKNAIVAQARNDALGIRMVADQARQEADQLQKQASHDRREADAAQRRAEQQQAALRSELARAQGDRLLAKAMSSATTDADLSVFYAREAVRLDPSLLMPLIPTLLEASRFRRASARLPFEQIGTVEALALSADGQRLVSVNNKELSAWRLTGAGAELLHRHPWPGALGDVNSAAFTPDGQWAAVATDERVWLWRMDGPNPELRPLEPALPAKRVKISADGRMLVALSNDGHRAVAWSLPQGQRLLDHVVPEADPELFDSLFTPAGAGQRLVLVAAPAKDNLGPRTLSFEPGSGGAFDPKPVSAAGKACTDAGYSYAAGGASFGVVLAPQLCLHDLRRIGAGSDAPGMSEEAGVVDDIVFSADGRYLVKLMRRTNEAQVVDLRSGAALRLQGAFDLPPSNSYESLLSISGGGERLAIKGNDGSVQLFDLAGGASALGESGGALWVSPDDQVVVVRTYTDAEIGAEARSVRSHALLRTLSGKGRHAEPANYVMGADGRQLHFRALCDTPVAAPAAALPASATASAAERPEPLRCVVSQDLQAPERPAHEQPYNRYLGSADDLYLLALGSEWLVYSAGAQAVVYRGQPPAAAPRTRSREAASPGIELGSGRVFAVKRIVGDTLKVEVYTVEGRGARLLRSFERPVSGGFSVSFRGRGRVLLLANAERSELWDLRSPSDTPAIVVARRSASEAVVHPESGVVALRAAGGAWELRGLDDGRVRGSLPASFQIEPSGQYAWAQMAGGWQIRALAEPSVVKLEGAGEVSEAQFSRTRGVVALTLQGGSLRVYSLQTRQPLFETETALLPEARLSGAGGYLLDSEGRLVPADGATLLASMQGASRRNRDSDAERCRLLGDAAACERARRAVNPGRAPPFSSLRSP